MLMIFVHCLHMEGPVVMCMQLVMPHLVDIVILTSSSYIELIPSFYILDTHGAACSVHVDRNVTVGP